MAYFGNQPLSASYLTDYFSGNNTTVAFTLTRAPVSASAVIITISGVKQAASTYGVSGTTLTFSAAPPTGTNNIEVLHLGVQPDTVVQPSYRTITEFTATAGQTTFSPASYTAGYIDVYRNGVKLGTADFTATNGTSVVLANACAAGDYVRFEGFLITSFNNAITNTAGAVGDSLIASVSASKLTGSQTLPSSVLPTGSVIQVVQYAANPGIFSTTSTSYVGTNTTATITPKFATSKIMIFYNAVLYGNQGSSQPVHTVYRNGSTDLAPGNGRGLGQIYTAASDIQSHGVGMFLDSPSTTAATVYKVYVKTNLGTIQWGSDGGLQTMTLMEIAA
jgi:hypothetical protein